jgi:hypothetical protein
MFRPESDDFFSYVIVFRLDGPPKLFPEMLEQELLAYYRGLAKGVSRGTITADGFSIEVKPEKIAYANNGEHYVATLKWVEPFVTKKPQRLRIEIRVWVDSENRRTWAFMSISPKATDHPIWKKMHEIRDNFLERADVRKDTNEQ